MYQWGADKQKNKSEFGEYRRGPIQEGIWNIHMIREENRTGQEKKRQGDPHEKSKPTRQVDKLALSRGGIGGLLEQRGRDKGEEKHASNPKGRRCQMDPNKNTFKYRHLQYCNEITKCLLQEFPIIGGVECLNFSNFPIPIF